MGFVKYLYDSAWAATAKYLRVGGLNNRIYFLTILEVEKSIMKVMANLGFGERALFLACRSPSCLGLHMAFSLWVHEENETALCVSLCKDTLTLPLTSL